MRLHRFYAAEPIGNKNEMVVFSTELANQIRRVFRLKKDDAVVLFDGSGTDYECTLRESDEKSLTFTVVSASKSTYMSSRDVYLCAAITKKDTFEWIVQKATELGVTHIIPVLAERSEKKSLNMARLEKIAVEASEQSGRGDVPKIGTIMKLEDALGKLVPDGDFSPEKAGVTKCDHRKIAFHTEGEILSKSEIEDEKDSTEPLEIFIGPEGGWSVKEIDMFHASKIDIRSLGRQILRAETAVISALSLVMLGE